MGEGLSSSTDLKPREKGRELRSVSGKTNPFRDAEELTRGGAFMSGVPESNRKQEEKKEVNAWEEVTAVGVEIPAPTRVVGGRRSKTGKWPTI